MPRRLLSSTRSGTRVNEVAADLVDVYVAGEGGLITLVVHRDSRKSPVHHLPGRVTGRLMFGCQAFAFSWT
jgi:hypothetical protein